MKKILILSALMIFFTTIQSQEIVLNGLHSRTRYNNYRINYGYELGYYYFLNRIKTGISISHYFCNKNYVIADNATSKGVYDPQNQRLAFNITLVGGLIEHSKSNFYIGGSIGLNYYRIKRTDYYFVNGALYQNPYKHDYWINNRLGVGLLFEYELNEIISNKISLSFKLNPEMSAFGKFLASGEEAWFIGWLTFQIGIKYKFKKDKKISR